MKKLCHIFTKVLVELFFITPLVASESASANKTIFKVGNKKESVTKSSFSKASGSSCKQRRKQVFASLRINSLKSIKFYEWLKNHTEALSFI